MSAATIRMLQSQVLVEQRIFWRNISATFFTFVLPLVMLFVLALSDDPSESIAGIVALGVLSTSFQGLAIQLSMHRDQGVLKGLMATPLPPVTFIAGKVLSIVLVVALETVIILAVGMLFLGAPAPANPLVLFAFILLATATFVALAFALASVIRSSDSAPAIVNAAYLTLLLVPILLAAADGLPDGVQSAGLLLPLTPMFEAVQHAWIDGSELDDWKLALILLGWCAAGVAWTVHRFRWEPSEHL